MRTIRSRAYTSLVVAALLLLAAAGPSLGSSCLTYFYSIWGFIDKTGRMVIAPQFREASDFHSGLAYVTSFDPKDLASGRCPARWSAIDRLGGYVIRSRDGIATGLSDGLALIVPAHPGTESVVSRFVDYRGSTVLNARYSHVGLFHEGLAEVGRTHSLGSKGVARRAGFIDRSGQEAISLRYTEAGDFSEGLAAVHTQGKWGYINKSGKMVIPARYDNASAFSEGLAVVTVDSKSMYIDKTGSTAISLPDDMVPRGSFSQGLAAFRKDPLWGYIDRSGHVVISPQFRYAGSFTEGLAPVEDHGHWVLIDREGQVVLRPRWGDQEPSLVRGFSEGRAAVEFLGEQILPDNQRYDWNISNAPFRPVRLGH